MRRKMEPNGTGAIIDCPVGTANIPATNKPPDMSNIDGTRRVRTPPSCTRGYTLFQSEGRSKGCAVGGGGTVSRCGGQNWVSYLAGYWPIRVESKYGIGIPRRRQRSLAAA